jgi:hypothetical protein
MALRRLVFPVQRRAELTREEFQRYWREQHAPLVRRLARTLGIQRYVQVHTDLNAETDPGRVARNAAPPHDGVAELWIDTDLAEGSIEERRAAATELLADERQFVDLEASRFFFGSERTIVDELGWTEAEPDASGES